MAENRFYLDREALVVLVTELLTRLKAKISEISESSSSAESTLTERIQQLEDALLHYVYKDEVPVEGSDEAYGKDETIYGDKYFYDSIKVDDFSYIRGKYITGYEGEEVGLVEYILDLLYSPDTKLVHTVRDETIAGNKTFDGNIIVNDFANILDSNNNTLQSYLSNISDASNLVHKTGNETITGNKTFEGDIITDDLYINTNIIHNNISDFSWIINDDGDSVLDYLDTKASLYGNNEFTRTNTFNGAVRFNGPLYFPGTLLLDSDIDLGLGSVTSLDLEWGFLSNSEGSLLEYLDSNMVHKYGNEQINGDKVFNDIIIVSDWSRVISDGDSESLDLRFEGLYHALLREINNPNFAKWVAEGNKDIEYTSGVCIRHNMLDELYGLAIDFTKCVRGRYTWADFNNAINSGKTILLQLIDPYRGRLLNCISYFSGDINDSGFYSAITNQGKIYILLLKANHNTNFLDNVPGSLELTPNFANLSNTGTGTETSGGMSYSEITNLINDICVLKKGDTMKLLTPLTIKHNSDSSLTPSNITLNVIQDLLDSTLFSPKISLDNNRGNKLLINLSGLDVYYSNNITTSIGNGLININSYNNNQVVNGLHMISNLLTIHENNNQKIFIGKEGSDYIIESPKFRIPNGTNLLILLANGDIIYRSELYTGSVFLGATTVEENGVKKLVLNFLNSDPIKISFSEFMTLPDLSDYYNKNDNPILTGDSNVPITNASNWFNYDHYIPTTGAVKNYVEFELQDCVKKIKIGQTLYSPESGIVELPNSSGGGNSGGSGIASGVSLWGNSFNGQSSVNGSILFNNDLIINSLENNTLIIKKSESIEPVKLKIYGDLEVTGNINSERNVTAFGNSPAYKERMYFDETHYLFLDNGVLKFSDNGTVKTVNLT